MLRSFLIKKIFYPLFLLKEGNYKFLSCLNEISKLYALPRAEFSQVKLDKLRKIARHVHSNSSYYNEMFEKYYIDPNLISFADLSRLPSLDKECINENKENIICSNTNIQLLQDSTGGSTGEPLVFYRNERCWLLRNAYQLYFNRLLGWDIGTKYALVWGASRDLGRNNSIKAVIKDYFVFNKIQLNATRMSKKEIRKFASRLVRFKPKIVYGYPSALDMLCVYMKENDFELSSVESVICTAEPLRVDQRERIGSFLNCTVYDRYASREVGILAQECIENKGMHINSLSVHLEIRNNKILVTDLDNFGMPLINYEIGDMAKESKLKESLCACGLKSELFNLGASRETDFFVKKDGTLVFGAGIPIMSLTGDQGVKNIQLIQKGYCEFVVNIVKNDDFTNENIARIDNVLKEYMGRDISIEYKYLSNIGRTSSSGKYRYVISEMSPN